MPEIKNISTKEAIQKQNNKKSIFIDSRPVDAFNGWRLKNESRGGHIPGAISLDAKWTKYIDWIEIVRQKGIVPEDDIVIYGYGESPNNEVASMFATAGYQNIVIYPYFTTEWIPNTDLPLKKLARYKNLVPAQWLKKALDGKKVEHLEGENLVICHAHYQNPKDYDSGHIPGAIPMDTNWLESMETWNRRSPEEIKTVLEKSGITQNSTVVVYGRFAAPRNEDPFPGSSAGHLGAMRIAFILLYAGVKDVKILNGGLQSWKDAGYEITSIPTEPETSADFGAEIPGRPELAVDVPQAKEMLQSADANLVCIRSWKEYIGEVSGYNYIEKTGRIPGAVFGNCGSDAYHMENYRHLDHTMRAFPETAEIWEDAGITPNKHNAFYCGTGWRGSEAFLNAWLMGWPRVSVYDGGWFEWSNDPANPIETGHPKDIDTSKKIMQNLL